MILSLYLLVERKQANMPYAMDAKYKRKHFHAEVCVLRMNASLVSEVTLILRTWRQIMENSIYWFWLCNIGKIGLKKIDALISFYGSPYDVFKDNNIEQRKIAGITEGELLSIKNSKDLIKIKENYAKLKSKGVYFVTKEDNRYPEKLRHIYDAPNGLYVKGNLPDNKDTLIAVVGSRNCSDYGREIAKYLTYELSKMGIHIISGLALGIDGYAHEGVLRAGGTTYGVLGCGIDICYPKENLSYYMDMQKNGGIISEYGLGVSPKPGFFPMRNRIISGISDGILVIEAKEKSGSLITVDIGLEQGKSIYAVPGRISDELSIGCNNLIKMGAKLVSSPKDIVEDFSVNYAYSLKENKKIDNLLETNEKIVYACLSLQGKHINEIANETNINIIELTNILINLEIKNYIKEIRNNYYVYIKTD
jgi:DNA processing protein